MNKSKRSQCVSQERTEPTVTNYDEYLQTAYERQAERYAIRYGGKDKE